MSVLSRTALQTEIDTKLASASDITATELRSVATDMADSAQHLDNGTALRFKSVTGTTNASEGSPVTVAHGLTSANIMDVTLLINYAGSNYIKAEYTEGVGYKAHIVITTSNIQVTNAAADSINILSKPFTVLITYLG